MNKILKICDVKNVYEARTLGQLGVPLVGFHLISDNDFARKNTIKRCIKELHQYYKNTKAILVTKEKNVQQMMTLIDDLEFDGVQLHYEKSDDQLRFLRLMYGNELTLFQVVVLEDKKLIVESKYADYIIIDRSYVGGSGIEIDKKLLNYFVKKMLPEKILLAGGIGVDNYHDFLKYGFAGFDVQSSVKDRTKRNDNISFARLYEFCKALGCRSKFTVNKIGFVPYNIYGSNYQLLFQSLVNGIDFLHIDVSDGFVIKISDLDYINNIIEIISDYNSHVLVQFQFFCRSDKSFFELYKKLKLEKIQNKTLYIHINRDNIDFFKNFYKRRYFFSVDVKDVINTSIDWENFVKKKIIISLQSKDHNDRNVNLFNALKMIYYSKKHSVEITIDRSLDISHILALDNRYNINAAFGNYLSENMKNRYLILKRIINE